jgi:hypothetical protein
MDKRTYITELTIYTEGVWNKVKARTAEGEIILGDWNEIEFRNNILSRINGWTHIIDQRL